MSELIDDELDGVVGGASDPAPSAIGGSSAKCPVCNIAMIQFSNRDTEVTCPNMKCKAKLKVVNGSLVKK